MEANEKNMSATWKSLFLTLRKLRLPWLWVLIALALNLAFNRLLLDLPNTTASLLGGELSGKAIRDAVIYYVMLGALSFVVVAAQVQAQSLGVRRARESVWSKMLGMRMEHFDRNDPSDLMSAIINDTGSAVNSMVNVIIYLVPDIYYIIAALLRINEYHWVLAVSCFAMLPLKYLYALVMGRKVQTANTKVYGRIGPLTSMGFDCVKPDGAFYLFVKAPEGDSAAGFCEKAKRFEILLVPSDSFGIGGYARLAYCVSERTAEASLPAFKKLAQLYGL